MITPIATNMDDLDKGWSWVVLVASFGHFMIFGMFLYGVGLAYMALLEEYGGKTATTACAGSLYAALVSLGGPISSLLIDRYSCRTAMFIDGVLTTLGCLITAFSHSLALCIFSYGIVSGIGGGIGYTAAMVVVGFNFRKFRNIAVSIAIAGVGIGTCILSPILEVLRQFYGNTGFFILLAGIGLHKCLFATLCRPSDLELLRQKTIRAENGNNAPSRKEILQHYAKVYLNKLVLCFSFSLMLFSLGTYMIFLHIPKFAVTLGFSTIEASLLLSTCGLSSLLSRLAITFVSGKKDIDEIVLYSGSFGFLALGTFLFPLYSKTYGGLLVYSLLLGTYFGGCYAIMNDINIKLVGLKCLSIATGIELLFCGIGTALGPVITGLIIDSGGTYEHAFMMAAFSILIGAALGMATVVFQPNHDKPEIPDLDYIVTREGDYFNQTISAQVAFGRSQRKTLETVEENDPSCRATDSPCEGGACDESPAQPILTTNQNEDNQPVEPINFTEEIQKLLKGEELKFIDET